jgi:hypothetical protein
VTPMMDRSCADCLEADAPPWLSERAQRLLWWTLVAFAAVDWIRPQLALTQEWWCVLFILWIVPWQRSTRVVSSLVTVIPLPRVVGEQAAKESSLHDHDGSSSQLSSVELRQQARYQVPIDFRGLPRVR